MAPEQGPSRTGRSGKVMKTWIYLLNKNSMIAELEARGIPTNGTLDELRLRLSNYIDEHPDDFRDPTPPAPPAPPADARSTNSGATYDADTAPSRILNQMRKWGVHFDGKDPWAFLERVEELREGCEYSDAQILRGIPELLRGDALLWCRNSRDAWDCWGDFVSDFKAAYLPRHYRVQLMNEIRERVHKPGEPYLKYATAVIALMRRAGGFSEEEQVEQLYQNLHPDYQWRIRRRDIFTKRDLLEEATELEQIQSRQKENPDRSTPRGIPITAAAYNRAECCWRLREGRRANQGLSPSAANGKRNQDRGNDRNSPVLPVSFTPRPHATVRVRQLTFQALIDTGSELSFVNIATAQTLSDHGYQIQPRQGTVQLADGQRSTLPGRIQLPIRIAETQLWHTFHVMPTLSSTVLIGVDLWGKLGCSIPAPPIRYAQRHAPRNAATGVMTQSRTENKRLREFLENQLPLFDTITGPTKHAEHHIRVKPGTLPIKQRYRPRNPAMQAIIDQEVEKMHNEGIIEKSHSPWSSPIVVVRKKDGKHRFCIDFRRVNDVTETDAYPLPQITATLDKLRGAKHLTTLDLKNGYWQVPLSASSRSVTAFTVPGKGLFQFKVMPFGLHSAPATFQRLLDTVLGPELEPRVFVYLDDIIVISSTFEEHLETLREVFERLRRANLRLNPEKCRFCVDRLKYLGHIVDEEGIRTDPEKTQAVTQWPTPQTVKQIRQFLGLASWYRRFIPDFATTAAPQTALTKKNARWRWANQAKPAGLAHATPVTRPWQQVTMDLVGPLPRSKKGNTWLLNIQDRFTKWVEMCPLRRATAPAVTDCIEKNLIYRHGCPESIHSDNGTQLRAKQLTELLSAFRIKHTFTPVHAPHCNPVERTNRTLKTMIAQFVGKNHKNWDEQLPQLQFAYNSAKHEATKYTPAFLNLGRELAPRGTPYAITRAAAPPPSVKQKRLEETFELVGINLARAFQTQQKYYNLRRRPWLPRIGEWVWKREYPLSNKMAAFNAKLAPKYAGPFEVRQIISPVIVNLRNRNGRWARHIHVQDLKPALVENTEDDDENTPSIASCDKQDDDADSIRTESEA
ncbi:PREDICTED: uncharacterized protein K02A2.6-like [Wasmannia auropunctata]|uniref:uncharacterized protein K02A2.6-like n=1 Tax=Wasmannia auropunctata TaxID=64793 RepID=UPI0005EDC767|nr:PREDICTED: uncharacterized protein K02A2.6-like [Wasmannia auropunctata]